MRSSPLICSAARAHLAAAHDTFILIVPERAFIAYPYERRGSDVTIADGALAIAFVAESTDGNAGLFSAHDEISGWGAVAC